MTTKSALSAMVGISGDYAISALTTPTTGLLFSHVVITSDATITDVKVMGESVKTARHYNGTLPTGYIICAGEAKYIDYVKLATGSAEGILFEV